MFFFFNDTAPTEIYTLSLHDALPISALFQVAYTVPKLKDYSPAALAKAAAECIAACQSEAAEVRNDADLKSFRSEEHTSELQSQSNLVCRLLLEKKKKKQTL